MKIVKSMTLFLGRLSLAAVSLFVPAASAQSGFPLLGSFSVSAEATPNTGGAVFCGGSATDQLIIEAHGTGFSTMGPFIFTLQKTLNFATGEYHGCLVLTAPNGDTLKANYHLTQQSSGSGNFSTASGTVSVTGGTGRFRGATGALKATGVFLNQYSSSSFLGGGMAPLQVAADYVISGSISFSDGN